MKQTFATIGVSILIALALAMGGINPFPVFNLGRAPDPANCRLIGHHSTPEEAQNLLNQLIKELMVRIVTNNTEGGVKIFLAGGRIVAIWGRNSLMTANDTNPTIFNKDGAQGVIDGYRNSQRTENEVSKISQLRWVLGWALNCRTALQNAYPAMAPVGVAVPKQVEDAIAQISAEEPNFGGDGVLPVAAAWLLVIGMAILALGFAFKNTGAILSGAMIVVPVATVILCVLRVLVAPNMIG